MRVTGKITLITLLITVASLLFNTYAKGSPAFFEPKIEETVKEACLEVKSDEKKDQQDHIFLGSGTDAIPFPFLGTLSQFASYCFYRSVLLQSHNYAFEQMPRYLFYCNWKVDIC
ncbi:hypothetical protein BH09BAC1_BH09BAC1_11500 [soil metagenome]